MDVRSLVTINLFISFVGLWIIMVVYNQYIIKVRFDEYRYKFFELRDRLALMAMKGAIDVESKEYTFLMELINYSITGFEDFKIVDFIKGLMSVKEKEETEVIVSITEKISNHSSELKEIAFEFYGTLLKAIQFKIKAVLFLMLILYWILNTLKICLTQVCKLNEYRISVSNKLDHLEKNREILAPV